MTVTGGLGVGGYSDDEIGGCGASSMQQTWFPSHIAHNRQTADWCYNGLHFTLTLPPVVMSFLPVPGHVVVCSALCNAL